MIPATTQELRALVDGLAEHPELWADLIEHDPDERTFGLVARTDRVEVWVVAWMAGHDTGFHDHDDCSAAIVVAEGAGVDERLALGGEPLATEHVAGTTFEVEPGGIHRVRHAGGVPAVTIHAYSPPLDRMGTYEVGTGGRLLRLPQAGDTALTAPDAEG